MSSDAKKSLQDAISLAWGGEVLSRLEEVQCGEAVTESYSEVKKHQGRSRFDSLPKLEFQRAAREERVDAATWL